MHGNRKIVDRFEDIGSMADLRAYEYPRPVRTRETITVVNECVLDEPSTFLNQFKSLDHCNVFVSLIG